MNDSAPQHSWTTQGTQSRLAMDLQMAAQKSWRATKWMLITVIAPGMILGKAWGDVVDAKDYLEELQKFG
jgi:hypothetical protein